MAIIVPRRHSDTLMLRTVRIVLRRLRQQFFKMSGKWRNTILLILATTNGEEMFRGLHRVTIVAIE
jgi:hypothetical protein